MNDMSRAVIISYLVVALGSICSDCATCGSPTKFMICSNTTNNQCVANLEGCTNSTRCDMDCCRSKIVCHYKNGTYSKISQLEFEKGDWLWIQQQKILKGYKKELEVAQANFSQCATSVSNNVHSIDLETKVSCVIAEVSKLCYQKLFESNKNYKSIYDETIRTHSSFNPPKLKKIEYITDGFREANEQLTVNSVAHGIANLFKDEIDGIFTGNPINTPLQIDDVTRGLSDLVTKVYAEPIISRNMPEAYKKLRERKFEAHSALGEAWIKIKRNFSGSPIYRKIRNIIQLIENAPIYEKFKSEAIQELYKRLGVSHNYQFGLMLSSYQTARDKVQNEENISLFILKQTADLELIGSNCVGTLVWLADSNVKLISSLQLLSLRGRAKNQLLIQRKNGIKRLNKALDLTKMKLHKMLQPTAQTAAHQKRNKMFENYFSKVRDNIINSINTEEQHQKSKVSQWMNNLITIYVLAALLALSLLISLCMLALRIFGGSTPKKRSSTRSSKSPGTNLSLSSKQSAKTLEKPVTEIESKTDHTLSLPPVFRSETALAETQDEGNDEAKLGFTLNQPIQHSRKNSEADPDVDVSQKPSLSITQLQSVSLEKEKSDPLPEQVSMLTAASDIIIQTLGWKRSDDKNIQINKFENNPNIIGLDDDTSITQV